MLNIAVNLNYSNMGNPFEEISTRLSNIESLLLDIKHSSPGTPLEINKEEEFLTVREAAVFLSVSVQTIYNMTHYKRIPFMKRAKKCYFLRQDLINYLKEGRKKSSEEISKEAEAYVSGKRKG